MRVGGCSGRAGPGRNRRESAASAPPTRTAGAPGRRSRRGWRTSRRTWRRATNRICCFTVRPAGGGHGAATAGGAVGARLPVAGPGMRGGHRRGSALTCARTSDQSVVPIADSICSGGPAKARAPVGVSSNTWSHIFRWVSDVAEVGVIATTTTHPSVGLTPQHRHHVVFLRRIQPGARLVNHEQRRSGDEFDRQRRAPAHLGRQLADPGRAVRRQLELFENLVHHPVAVLGRGVRRQPQFGGVSQGSFDGELRVQAVVARHYPDACAHRLGLGVHVVAVHGDSAGARAPWCRRAGRASAELRAADGPITAVNVPGRAL